MSIDETRKPRTTPNKLLEGYNPTLVRSDVFDRVKDLQKQQQPRFGAKELVTALLDVALRNPESVAEALRQARCAMAEELRKQANQLEQQ